MNHYKIELHDLGNFSEHPIQARFPAVAKIIEASGDLRYVLTVDTRDVVFQSNPMTWIKKNIGDHELLAVSEGLYGGATEANVENKRRLTAAFGQEVSERMKNSPICNGGVVAGLPAAMRDLQLAIYDLCPRVPGPVGTTGGWPSDQEILSFLINSESFASRTRVTGPKDGFAFTFDHLHHGAVFRTETQPPYRRLKVYPPESDVPYAIFHQYLDWKEIIQNVYGCNDSDCL